MRGDVGRFPDRAFGRLAVAEQHVGAVVGLDAARVQRDADRGADALAERAGRDVDERQPRRRMAFEIRVDLAQLQQLGRDRTRRPRPTRRTGAARRAPSTARSDRCRDAADPSDRTASRRRTARPRGRPPSSSSSDGRCRLRTSSATESIRSRVAMFLQSGNERGAIHSWHGIASSSIARRFAVDRRLRSAIRRREPSAPRIASAASVAVGSTVRRASRVGVAAIVGVGAITAAPR